MLTFTSQDAQGNAISGSLGWGQAHDSPPCIQGGVQPYQGVEDSETVGAIGGTYNYLGRTYTTQALDLTSQICPTQFCSISISSAGIQPIVITLGYQDASGGQSFITLDGIPDITSSVFGTTTGTDGKPYLFSDGTFNVGNVPEPAEWSLGSLGMLLLLVRFKNCRRGAGFGK